MRYYSDEQTVHDFITNHALDREQTMAFRPIVFGNIIKNFKNMIKEGSRSDFLPIHTTSMQIK